MSLRCATTLPLGAHWLTEEAGGSTARSAPGVWLPGTFMYSCTRVHAQGMVWPTWLSIFPVEVTCMKAGSFSSSRQLGASTCRGLGSQVSNYLDFANPLAFPPSSLASAPLTASTWTGRDGAKLDDVMVLRVWCTAAGVKRKGWWGSEGKGRSHEHQGQSVLPRRGSCGAVRLL